MPPRIMNLYFEADLILPIMLLLEPFESSWARVHKVSSQLIQALSGQIEALYFLGSAKRYSVSLPMEFVDKAPSWFREHKNRVSLLNPLLEEKERQGFPGMGLVVCSKLPVDFDDWLHQPILDRMIFVNVGEESFDLEENEIDFRAGIEPILEALKNPPAELAVEGQGFFPLCFKETEGNSFEAGASQGRLSIRASSPKQRCALHLKALCPGEPKLTVTRSKGNTEIIAGRHEKDYFGGPRWQEFPDRIGPILEAMRGGRSYVCPQCGKPHASDCLVCPQGGQILQGFPFNTSVLFTATRYLPLSEFFAYSVTEEKVITKTGAIYQWVEPEWKFSRQVAHCERINDGERIDDGMWAIYDHLR